MLVHVTHLTVRLTCSDNGSSVFEIQPGPWHENDPTLTLLSRRSPIEGRNFHITFSTVSVRAVRHLKISYQLHETHSFFRRYCVLLSPIRATCPAHRILDLINRILLGEQYRSYNLSLFRLSNSTVMSSILGPNIFHSTLFSNTLSLCSFVSMRYQVHTHTKQQVKLQFCVPLIFLNSKIVEKIFCTER